MPANAAEAEAGPWAVDLCPDCFASSYAIESPEGPVEIVVIRPMSALGEYAGLSYVALSWYSNGVNMGDHALSTVEVRDLVANSVAASVGTAARNFDAGVLQIGAESVEAVAVTGPSGVTARTGAIAYDGGVLVVTSVIRPAEPAVAMMTAMLQTIDIHTDEQGEEE
jgi:hypothetical protein